MNKKNERIDTSKYEGHALSLESVLSGYFTIEQIKEVDKTLMEDAPEILADLKRSYEEIDALRSIIQDWVKIETFSDDGKDLFVDMEDSDGNCFSGYLDSTTDYDE